MNQVRKVLARNSAANIVRAGASSAVGVFLPLILLLILQPDAFAAWALIFSLASYILFFDVGVPATLQALVSKAKSAGEFSRIRHATDAALTIAGMVVGVFLILACAIAASLDTVVSDLPVHLLREAQVALVVVCVGQSANLVGNFAAAYFLALQRSHVPAVVIAPARLISLAAAVGAAATTGSTVATSVAYAVPCVLGTAVLLSLLFKETRVYDRDRDVDANYTLFGVLRYSGPLILWSITMLASTGLGTLIVARFAYEDLVPFSIAQIVYTAISGLMAAIASPLLPELSRNANSAPAEFARRLILATRVHSAVLYTVASLAVALIPAYLWLVAPDGSSTQVSYFGTAIALVWATTIHISATPLSMGFIATARHHKLILAPVCQAIATVGLALVLVTPFGAFGVALGMTVGSLVGLLLTLTWSVWRAKIQHLPARTSFLWTVGIPGVSLLITTATTTLISEVNPEPWVTVITLAFVCFIAPVWNLRFVLPRAEFNRLGSLLHRGSGNHLSRPHDRDEDSE